MEVCLPAQTLLFFFLVIPRECFSFKIGFMIMV
jgi:hypothetical protein